MFKFNVQNLFLLEDYEVVPAFYVLLFVFKFIQAIIKLGATMSSPTIRLVEKVEPVNVYRFLAVFYCLFFMPFKFFGL